MDGYSSPEENAIRAKELGMKALGDKGKEKKEELEEKAVEKLHSKHGVRSGKGPDRKAGA